jgi:flagellar basal-body rod modification protein FlgD
MQNQDPTADTDPNEYINQLVQVNSLEQLIDINQNLSTALEDSSTSSASAGSSPVAGVTSALNGARPASTTAPSLGAAGAGGALSAAQHAAFGAGTAGNSGAQASAAWRAPGNLSAPNANPSAHRVAHALDGHVVDGHVRDGRSNAQPVSAGLPGTQ